jgi:hypothetical protein
MATLISQTQWHGNPRPVTSYASTLEDGLVASPYYLDGRDVPQYAHLVTAAPLGDLAPTAVADVPGPDVLVSFDVGGAWLTGSSLTILLTLVGSPNISTSLSPGPTPAGPDQAAEAFAAALDKELSVTAGAVDGKVTISAVVPTTSITITTLTPVTP